MTLSWLPNAISLLRIVLVLPVAILIVRQDFDVAIYLFVVAGISDGVDGFLAKTFGWHSRLGALLDPAADKLLLIASFAALFITGLIPLWLALLVVARDIIIVGGATAYHFFIQPLEGAPTAISKINTALELAFVLAVLLAAAWQWPLGDLIIVLGAAVLVTVVVSGMDYVWSWTIKARHDKAAL